MSGDFKLAGAAALATAAVTPEAVILGVQTGVLLAGLAGALFGLAYSPPGTLDKLVPDKKLGHMEAAGRASVQLLILIFGLLTNAFVAAWVANLIPHMFPMFKAVPHAPLAGILAFSAQHMIPKAFAAGEKFLNRRAEK